MREESDHTHEESAGRTEEREARTILKDARTSLRIVARVAGMSALAVWRAYSLAPSTAPIRCHTVAGRGFKIDTA